MISPIAGARLSPAVIEQWLAQQKFSLHDIENQVPIWPTKNGLVALTMKDVERKISIEDPVQWAWLNLVERKSVRGDDDEVVVVAGNPWRLFDVQSDLIRIVGNLIVECGSEVGKTRDIVLGTLHEMDTCDGNASSLIAADSDITLQEIWTEIEGQLALNPLIGGGVVTSRVKPYREKIFRNGNSFQMRLCGFDGKQFRGCHVTKSIRADEAAKWKYQQQWNELWRAGTPGVQFRIYSTPDGDYSSPFYAMCDRAIPIDGRPGTQEEKKSIAVSSEDEPRFLKFNIRKPQLPYPFWSEKRAAKLREQYGGEQSIGWLTNVEGRWGTPSYSVFPMPTLKPCLRYLSHYRIVVVSIDREKRQVIFNAARLTNALESVDGGAGQEEMLAREQFPFVSAAVVGEAIARYFPTMHDWKDPLLYCGGDLGFSQDPSEFVFVRVIGKIWQDVFRLNLRHADAPDQADVLMYLDHASGHRVFYGFDNGSAGAALVQFLTQNKRYSVCPVCGDRVYWAERLKAFGFGEYNDEIDIETGAVLPNPDKHDKNENEMPHRISNKEFSTRILERKTQLRELEIAYDGGAGNQSLSAPQLLVNHTMISVTKKGERVFKGTDDHHVDARRQCALAIVLGLRDIWIDPGPDTMRSIGVSFRPDEFTDGSGLPASVGSIFSSGRVFGEGGFD